MRAVFITYILLLLLAISSQAQDVLSVGIWYEVAVETDGIYKIDRQVLNDLGVPVNDLDPRRIGLYGSPITGQLPQVNQANLPTDLVSIPIWVEGADDGVWNNGDYILFYGFGPDLEQWDAAGAIFEKNIYADRSHYYLRIDDPDPSRITTQNLPAQINKVSTGEQLLVFEEDRSNLLKSGRTWYGQTFSVNSGESASYTYSFPFEVSPLEWHLQVAAQSQQSCNFVASINGEQVSEHPLASVPFGSGTTYDIKARESQVTQPLALPPANSLSILLNFTPGGSPSVGFLDRWWLRYQFPLRHIAPAWTFHARSQWGEPLSTFRINDANASIRVWQVFAADSVIEHSVSVSNGEAEVTGETSNHIRFVVFEGSSHPRPLTLGEVNHESINSLSVPEGLIISHPDFREQADELAAFHRSQDGLDVQVVETTQIFRTYGGGKHDLSAIRNYIRFLYERDSRLRYVLLFGDASYDYKDRVPFNTNYVPIYESFESYDPIYSYSSDDYLGFLEPGEGTWNENPFGDHTLEIGIGRLPVKDTQEAQRVVEKIKRYVNSSESLGAWRQRVVYIVDDGDDNIHVDHGERLSTLLDTSSFYLPSKIYLDSYSQLIEPDTERSPDMKDAIIKAIDRGALIVDFIGHGNEQLWMDEQVFTNLDISSLSNFEKLPLFVTATCEFGRYDDPIDASGAERLLLNNSGAIALLTTTRPVFANTNFEVNRSFHEALTDIISGDEVPRLGDIIRQTKNNSLEGPINRNFALLGDPMLRLAYPQYDVQLDAPITGQNDTLSALEPVEITGMIADGGNMVTDFDGEIELTVWDLPQAAQTRGQQSLPVDYEVRTNAIFRGKATVNDGRFESHFIVPRNISYENEKVLISLYAIDENGMDASGEAEDRVTGGTFSGPGDQTAPQVSIFLNDSSFSSGDRVSASPLLLVQFFDESGISISNTGFDRGITMELDGIIEEINDYYVGRLDDSRYGTAIIELKNLNPGRHLLKIKAGDTHNNFTSTSVEFVVSNERQIRIIEGGNYPNPVQEQTTFFVRHDRDGEPVELTLDIISFGGELVSQTVYEIPFSSGQDQILVDVGRFGLRNGLYIYRLGISSQVDEATNHFTGRLVIRN